MEQITYYHNPRCRKSREGLELLRSKGVEPEITEYMKAPLSLAELKSIVKKLGIAPGELLRKNEAVYKSDFKGKNLSDEQILQAMIDEPKLMQRPIAVKGGKAVVGRPVESLELLVG